VSRCIRSGVLLFNDLTQKESLRHLRVIFVSFMNEGYQMQILPDMCRHDQIFGIVMDLTGALTKYTVPMAHTVSTTIYTPSKENTAQKHMHDDNKCKMVGGQSH
jgi:hypothetical protein